ncbi:MAG: alpha/beta fold hydrolase [Pseudomonadota bacterium]
MKRLAAISLLVMSGFGVPLLAGASSDIPIEDFFRSETVSPPILSPTGRFAAIHLFNPDGKNKLVIQEVATKERRALSGGLYGTPIGIGWIDERRFAYFAYDEFEVEPIWNRQFMVYDAVSRDIVLVSDETKKRSFSAAGKMIAKWLSLKMIHPLPDDPDYVLAQTINLKIHKDAVTTKAVQVPRVHKSDVFRLNITKTAKLSRVERNPGDVVRWIPDHDGRILMSVAVRDNKTVYQARASESDPWVVIASRDRVAPNEDYFDVIGFSETPDEIFVMAYRGKNTLGLHRFSLSAREFTETVFQHEKYDVHDIVWSPDGRTLQGVGYYAEKYQQVFFDADLQGFANEIKSLFPEMNASVRATGDLSSALITASSDRDRARHYLFDGAASAVTEVQRASVIPSELLARTEPITIEASDEVSLPGYLTKPAQDDSNGALVVMVHGGPFFVRDHWEFDPVIQYLVSRGYSVLQVNFRGSGGYGIDFVEAGYGEWDRRIQDDLRDATLWAKRSGLYEGDRVAIYGGSFGGFSAMMSLARFPDLYKCGVSLAGVSDLKALYETDNGSSDTLGAFLRKTLLGDRTPEQLLAASPVSHVEKISVPMLIVHGGKDEVVLPSQSEALVAALAAADKPHESYVYPSEPHGFRGFRNRLHFAEKLRRFLDAHVLKDEPETAGASD